LLFLGCALKAVLCWLSQHTNIVASTLVLKIDFLYLFLTFKNFLIMSDEGYKIRDQKAIHFVTFTVVDWVDVFTRPIYKDVVIDSLKYCQQNKGLVLFAYVIMSNHIHLIIQDANGKLSDLIRDMKRHIANKILELIETGTESRKDWMLKRFEFAANGTARNENYKFWKQGNHPEEIFTEDFMWTKLNYVHLNPVRQGIVTLARHYLYSSASNYVLDKGLIDVAFVSLPHFFVGSSRRNLIASW
jgi:REP element-mobilizing transposase RayT